MGEMRREMERTNFKKVSCYNEASDREMENY